MKLDPAELTFTFSRSQGAGGQNINKVNSKATLTWDITESKCIPLAIRKRFALKFERYLVNDKVVIHSQRFRTQSRNKQDCIEKLEDMLNEVRTPPKKRIATRPSKAIKQKRLDAKKKHSEKKSERGKKF